MKNKADWIRINIPVEKKYIYGIDFQLIYNDNATKIKFEPKTK